MPPAQSHTGSFERWVNLAIVLAIALACVLVVHKSSRFITTQPMLAVDDSIPNVAVALAEHGRYGFLSSPTQGPREVDRTHAFYNYGPAYFYVAAAASWLFGPSLTLFRMLHPLGVILIVLGGVLWFRRLSMAGAAVLAVGLIERYFNAHQPIARPDIVVSMFAALMFVFAARAVEGGGWRDWFGAGFCAASAVTSHQIAVVLVPAAGVIWLWTCLALRREWGSEFRSKAVRSLAAINAGGIAGALVYLAAIDFRFIDLWELGTAGVQTRAAPFLPTVLRYYNVAWTALADRSWLLIVAGLAVTAVLALAAQWLPPSRRRQVLAHLMPPLVVAVAYQFSIGFWGSVSAGYVILSQVATVWAVAAGVALLTAWARRGQVAVLRVTGAAMLLLAAGAVVRADAFWLATPSTLERQMAGSVDLTDYTRELIGPLPERASTWGTLAFGVDAGDRTDLVQFQQVSAAALDTKPEFRHRVQPDALLLSAYEFADSFAYTIAGLDNAFRNFFLIFPGAKYRQLKLVNAAPYGTSIVYQRIVADGTDIAPEVPEVAVNDGSDRQWSSGLSAPIPVTFDRDQPTTVQVDHYDMHVKGSAVATRSALLPHGFYLIELELGRSADAQTGFILSSLSRHFVFSGQSQLPVTPYFVGDRRVHLLVDHWGGRLFLSRFEPPLPATGTPSPTDVDFEVRSVRRVVTLGTSAVNAAAVGVDAWPRKPGIGVAAGPDGDLQVTAANGAWVRIDSEPIAVKPHQRMMLVVPVTGPKTVTVGILNVEETWLVIPVVQPRRVIFNTGAATAIRIALDSPEAFSVGGGPILTALGDDGLYADSLVSCRSNYLPRSAGCREPRE